MARLTLRPHNQFVSSPIFSHKQPFLSVYTIFPHHHHNPLIKSRVKCSASGTERVRESKKLPPKDPLEDPKPQLPIPEVLSTETGFEQNWPPWKNIPQRYKLIGATSLAFVICNMDKVNLSIAIIPMSHQFGWSSSVAGLVQSSFFWGYALSQLPGGWLSKIFGGRKVLEIGVFTWSFATALVPLLAGFMPGLIFSRILVGIGEGVSPSAATDLIARTIPVKERSRAVGFVFGGLSLGSVMGLLLAPPIIETFNWESVFYLFGLLGVGWFVGFQFLNEEEVSYKGNEISTSHKSENATKEELGSSLKEIPWKSFFQSPAVWAMIYTHFCGSWGHYTCLSWLPTYFSEALSLNLTEAAWVSIKLLLSCVFPGILKNQFSLHFAKV
ncbi:PHT4 [Arabidopsis thaliana]|uniref:PHT4 n=1 Tax=Arabidopsis thaliana TaxID=3702 RepID=A0A178UND5_ARATH|nr:PHT4 [Arabidopsis thaliana]